MIVYRGMRARDFAHMLYGGQIGEYVTTDPGLAAWYARLWAEVHRDPEPGVVAVFQVDSNRLVPDEYGYETGARNVEFRLEDFRGIAGADGFEPGDKSEVLPGRRGFDSPGLHHPPCGTPFGRGPQARSTTPSCRADSPHSGGLPRPQDGPETLRPPYVPVRSCLPTRWWYPSPATARGGPQEGADLVTPLVDLLHQERRWRELRR